MKFRVNPANNHNVPLLWYPRLWHGTSEERQNWRFIGEDAGIHWPDLDEDISIEGLLLGKRSGESQRSLNRWLEKRTTKNGDRSLQLMIKSDETALTLFKTPLKHHLPKAR